MSTCHGKDNCITVDSDNIPRARESLCLGRLIAFFVEALFARANHCQNLLGRDVDLTNRMVLCIAHIDEVLVLTENVAEALWVMELRLGIVSIDKANLSVSDLLFKLHCFFVDQHDTVIGCVRHNDQVVI